MSRATIILNTPADKARALNWVNNARPGVCIEFKDSKRTLDQNALLWAALTDIARQKDWHGIRLSPDDWKLIFMDARNREMRLVPNLEGNGFVNLGRSSSKLTKEEMGDLINLIQAFAAREGIALGDQVQAA